MAGKTQRVVAWSVILLASVVMLLLAVYKAFWVSMGSLALDRGPIPGIYIANLIEVPVYFASAVTAWKWPWVAESVALLTLAVVFARFNPWTISPFQRWLSFEYAFVIAANVAIVAKMWLRRAKTKHA
jgi:hypothetical protein